MSSRTLVVLAVVAALGVGAALWSMQARKPAQETAAAQPLVPGLQDGINSVTALRVVLPGEGTVATIERGDAGWSLKERGGYAVDTSKVRDLLVALGSARRVERKTANPALYDKLGLVDIDQPEATGAQVEIDGLAQPARLILGQNVIRGDGTFVRAAGDAQSWQIDSNIAVERAPAKWLKPEVVDIATSRVVSVRVTHPEGAPIEIARADGEGSAEFVLRNMPRGREPESTFAADALAGLLSGLRLDDVRPAAQAEPGDAKTSTAAIELDDGTTVTMTAWKAGDHTLARLAATLGEAKAAAFVEKAQARAAKEAAATAAVSTDAMADAAATTDAATDNAAVGGTSAAAEQVGETAGGAPATAAAPTTPALDPAADREQRLAAIREGVAKMQADFAPWTYTLPSFKASNLDKTLESYLKPKS